MITQEEFNDQLVELNRLFKHWNKTSDTYLSQSFSSNLFVTFSLSEAYSIELKIIHDDTYQEPTILFRIIKASEEDNGIHCSTHILLNMGQLESLLNLEKHSVTLVTLHDNGEVWYKINNCDTALNVGPEQNNYLKRWLSSYMLIFDRNFNDLFLHSENMK